MNPEPLSAVRVADLLLRADAPPDPDAVTEAARTIALLVQRLNDATRDPAALRYPRQADRTIRSLRAAVQGLKQTFDQIADRLDGFTADPRVTHDAGDDPRASCTVAAYHMREASVELQSAVRPLDRATALTHGLGYHTGPRAGTVGFPPPTVHSGPPDASDGAPQSAPPPARRIRR